MEQGGGSDRGLVGARWRVDGGEPGAGGGPVFFRVVVVVRVRGRKLSKRNDEETKKAWNSL